jgi:HEAT repeat protein
MEQVRAKLELIEPDYAEAAKLGPEAIPFLEQLAKGTDILLATRAVYLASLIGGRRAARLLLDAATSPVPEIRVQAAAGAQNLPEEKAEKILLEALGDSDFGVRNVALKSTKLISTKGNLSESIQQKVKALSKSDPEQFIREFSNGLLKQ